MKKITLLLLGLLMITSASAVEYQYMPVLSEGKSWEVATVKTDSPSDTTGIFNIYVVGDTLVNNLTCKKIEIVSKDNSISSNPAVAYEENGKVWKLTEDGTKVLLFDMGLDVNDFFDAGYVLKSDTITLNGVSRKRLVIDSGADCDDYLFYVVEGIGISSDKWLNPRLGIADEGEYCTMLSCSENGETVFTTEDFKMENEYVPLVREGVVWEYVGFRQDDDENPIYTLYTLEFNGTTTIDGKLYHKIYRTDYDKQGNAQEPYFVTFVREENKVVTVYNTTNEEDEYFYYTYWFMMPKTLYDFSKPMFLPDEAYIPFGDEGPYDYNTNYTTYSSIDVEVGESVRKGYFIDHGNDYESFKTIEGIGVDCDFGDLLIPYRTYYTGFNPMASLAAVYENGELVYKGRAYDKAQKLKYPVEGDADGDGVVTSADITLIYCYLLGDYMLNPDVDYNFENCDINGDGSITSADVTAVYNILLGNSN